MYAVSIATSPATGLSTPTVLTPDIFQTVPLQTQAAGVADAQTVSGQSVFATTSSSPSFVVTVTSAYTSSSSYVGIGDATNPLPSRAYYQLDTAEGNWQTVSNGTPGANPASYNLQLSNVPPGVHILYTYAAYGNGGTLASAAAGTGNSPETGNLTGYVFAVLSAGSTMTSRFTLTAAPTSLTIAPGSSGSTTLTLTPQLGYAGAVSLSCINPPAGTTCSFSSSTVQLNSSPAQATLTIALSTATQSRRYPMQRGFLGWWSGGLLTLSLLGTGRRKRKQTMRMVLLLLTAVSMGGAFVGMTGCGGGSTGQPGVHTESITVQAQGADGGSAQIVSVQVTVQ